MPILFTGIIEIDNHHFECTNDDVFMFDANNHREGQKNSSGKKKTGGHDSCLSTRISLSS